MSDQAIERFRRLARNGLSVEQILLASGVLNKKQYFALLEIASGLPVVEKNVAPVQLEMFPESEMRKRRAIPFEEKKGSILMAFAAPTTDRILSARDLFRRSDLRVIPHVISEADFKRSLGAGSARPMHSIAERMVAEAERAGLVEFLLIEHGDGARAVSDTFHPLPIFELSSEELAAFVLFFGRKKKQLGWNLAPERAGLCRAYRITRSGSGAHPLDWAGLSGERVGGEGLTVLICHDPYLNGEIGKIPEFTHFSDWNRNIRKYDTRSKKSRELALHAALAGESVLALATDDDAWWNDLPSAGIPVKVLKANVTPQGRTWEVYRV